MPLAAFAPIALTAALALVACGCAQGDLASTTPWDRRPEARDELLFALPYWCGKTARRRPWTEWAIERERAPTGNGVCGVRAPDDSDDEGLCIEIEGGVIQRASRRKRGPALAVAGLVGQDAGRWVAATAGDDPMFVRVEGTAVTLATHEQIRRGPCFWR